LVRIKGSKLLPNMIWARVWIQFTTILNVISDVSDTIVLVIASRMVRDSDEISHRIPSTIISKGFLILDMLLTMMFIFTAGFILNESKNEMPTMPLRFWIVVFMFYCIFHIFLTTIQYEGGSSSQTGSIMFKYVLSFFPESYSSLFCFVLFCFVYLNKRLVSFRNLEYKKNVFGIFLWGLGMFFMVKGADQMFLAAPKLTRYVTIHSFIHNFILTYLFYLPPILLTFIVGYWQSSCGLISLLQYFVCSSCSLFLSSDASRYFALHTTTCVNNKIDYVYNFHPAHGVTISDLQGYYNLRKLIHLYAIFVI